METRVYRPGTLRLQSLNENNESPLFQRRKTAHQIEAEKGGNSEDKRYRPSMPFHLVFLNTQFRIKPAVPI